jgi:hypothetical protein
MKKFIQLFVLLLVVNIYGQDLGAGFDMPQITRPEASVANLMTFEEIPVSNYTGIPQVNVPLFSLPTRSKDIALNMGLAYHPANGVMHNAQAGDCGLGWSLIAGGVISRTLVDKPDEFQNNYEDSTKRDIYQFNFFGHTGRFFIDKASNGTLTLRVLDSANSKLVFNLDYNLTTSIINSITVFDDKGYKYVFQTFDTSYTTFIESGIHLPVTYKSTFHLNQILDNNNQILINFSYNEFINSLIQGSLFVNKFQKIIEINAIGYGKVQINYSTGADLTYNETRS